MRSFTSSSEGRFVVALAMTFAVLVGGWEAVLRLRAGASARTAFDRPSLATSAAPGEQAERWVVFGNCLVMTGISPRQLEAELADGKPRTIVDIAAHEQSPLAFFDYLRRAGFHPDVVVANVSSWLNGTNFDQEADLVAKSDPLRLLGDARPAAPGAPGQREQAFRKAGDAGQGEAQRAAEAALARWGSTHARVLARRHHLFDYLLFLGTLATTASLDDALYQLNMQAWFAVTEHETDGLGFLGLHVRYRDDWDTGLERMADRSLQRLRLSRLLTPRYWALLDEQIGYFQAKGTQIVLVRMPEHPRIRAFNDETYDVSARLRGYEERRGVTVVDLSQLGPPAGVRLFDAVHPDADAAHVITRELGARLRERRGLVGGTGAGAGGEAADRRPPGGG
jgi:hypothetical protein